MKIVNNTDLKISIHSDGNITKIPAGESIDISSASGKITVYSDKKTSTRVDEHAFGTAHFFCSDIITSCKADISKFPKDSEITLHLSGRKFQEYTNYEYFTLKCNRRSIEKVTHEIEGKSDLLADLENFKNNYKDERRLGCFGYILDILIDIGELLVLPLIMLLVSGWLSALICLGIMVIIFIIGKILFGGIDTILRRSKSRVLQKYCKQPANQDDIDYFIDNINKYCK